MPRDNVRLLPAPTRTLSPGTTKVRQARRAAGLTQEQAAQAVGVDVRTYRRWEHGRGVRAVDALVVLERLAQRRAA